MKANSDSDPWFLTGLDAPNRQDTNVPEARRTPTPQPAPRPRKEEEELKPFRCPPIPKVTSKRPYYSPSGFDSRMLFSDAEKHAILSRLDKRKEVDKEGFQNRLEGAKDRNTEEYLSEVHERANASVAMISTERVEDFKRSERKREDILFRHKNMIQLHQMETFVNRAKAWYEIIVSHVFLTALIQERKVQEALDKFGILLIPMVFRFLTLKRKRKEAEQLVKEHLRDIPFPYPNVIQSMYGTFFTGWPPYLLEQLVANAKPQYLKKGSYLMHEGDIGRVMFMITVGSVSIILRKKGKDKRRTKDNSSGVFQIKAPCYVGEFALVCKEPRSASIYCETDIGFWAVLPEDYEEVAKQLSPEVASKQREATDERRRQNLKRFFPLRVDFLRNFKYFETFSDAALTKLIELVEPLVLHDGDYLFKMGEMDSSVYFIQDGVAMEREANGEQVKVTTGSCVGMFECSCGVNERKRNSIISINYCDIWRLRRETLIDIGMSEPQALLDCRAAAKEDRARSMKKDGRVMRLLKRNPFLNFALLPTQLHKVYEICTPCIYLNDERLVWMGQPLTNLVLIVSGSVNIAVTVNGEQKTVRFSKCEEGGPDDSGFSIGGSGGNSLTTAPTSLTTPPILDPGPMDDSPFGLIGAYEFVASFSQYVSSVTSFGLTEAYVIDKTKLDAILTAEQKTILRENVAARDIVMRAYKSRDMSILRSHMSSSFAQKYKTVRDAQKEKGKK